MCGISCLLSMDASGLVNALMGMTRVIRHRGPDNEGYMRFIGGRIETWNAAEGAQADEQGAQPISQAAGVRGGACLGLGHRRLAIVDTSRLGHQPMSYEAGRYWITYNGELYNYVELRRELERVGHQFASSSDTEVILAAYSQWGENCVARFNGMWALVIFDASTQTLFVARDRFGVKPLYYWVGPYGHLAIASEIKQFAALPGWSARLNPRRCYDFLVWSVTDHTDETLFAGVFQLRPGHCIKLDLAAWVKCVDAEGRLRSRAWYRLEVKPFGGSFEDAAREYRQLLTDSVRMHLRADVPVGSCLSGGVDSSSIVCVANRLLRRDVDEPRQNTFTAVVDAPCYNEHRYVHEVVRATAVASATVKPTVEGLFSALDALVWHQDEPFGSTSVYAQWEVFRLAAGKGVKVMLDGQGADETLGGYPVFYGARLAALVRRVRLLSLVGELRELQRVRPVAASYLLKSFAAALTPVPLLTWAREFAEGVVSLGWLNIGKLGVNSGYPFVHESRFCGDSIASLSRVQLLESSLPMLLRFEDRNSMAHSIEARVPFLDYRVVEFALGLPDRYKIRDGLTKAILREAMRGVIPEAVRTRADKLGFVTPEKLWLREHGADLFRRALRDAVDASAGILRPSALELLERVIRGRRPFSFLIWRLISFGSWMRVFGVRA